MKRKILIGTLLIGTMLTATLGFAACGEEKHTHTPVKVVAVSATCTEDGNKEYYTCSGCDKVYADEACTTETTAEAQKIPATGHTPNADDGNCTTAITCTDCGTETTVAKSAHTDNNADGVCDVCTSEIDYIYNEVANIYTVYTADGLYAWAESISGGSVDAGLVLAKNIVMPTEMNFDLDGDGTNESNWEPLYFNGTIEGNGYSIAGVTMIDPASMCGFLFNLYENGIIRNLSLTDVRIEGLAVGGIVYENHGVIANCNIDGVVQSTDSVGGIVATNNGTITACRNAADVKGSAVVGGIVAQMTENSAVIACYNTGTIISTYVDYGPCAGGVAGSFFAGNITACYNTGRVAVASDTANVGGVVGYAHNESETLLASYWSAIGDTPTQGNGSKTKDENALEVDGSTITWETAMTAMNTALESAGSDWRYALNTGEDADIRPLILVKAPAVVQTTIDEEVSLPQFMSLEVDKTIVRSSDTLIDVDVYMGYDILNADGATFSDIVVPEEDFAKYTFVLEIDYNNETSEVAMENLNYFEEYRCDAYQGVVYYNNYETIQFDIDKMTGKANGFVNVELYMISETNERYLVSAETLYYSVTDTEIVFGLVSDPVANEGDPGIVTNGWEYRETTP